MYKKELILDKNFMGFIVEYCQIFGYSKTVSTRINNCLKSYHYITDESTIFDFISTHNRTEINRTIAFHNIGKRGYSILLDAINSLNIPLKDEPGYKRMFNQYHQYLDNKVLYSDSNSNYEDLKFEFNVLKEQLKKNREILIELIEINKNLDNKIDNILNEVGVDLDGKKHR